MKGSPIFDQLQAEFVEKSKFCWLRVGPPAGPGFEEVNGIKIGFEIVNGVTKLMKMGPVAGDNFEVVDDITKLIQIEEEVKPRLYIIEGAPELIDLSVVNNEETEMEKTVSIPAVENETPKPPSLTMLADTQVIPVVPSEDEALIAEDDKQYVVPLKRSTRITSHKISATRSFGFFSRAA